MRTAERVRIIPRKIIMLSHTYGHKWSSEFEYAQHEINKKIGKNWHVISSACWILDCNRRIELNKVDEKIMFPL